MSGSEATPRAASHAIRMSVQVDRVRSTRVALDGEQELRFRRLRETLVMIDLHQHPIVLPEDMADLERYMRGRRLVWGYDAVRRGGWTAVGTANILSSFGTGRDFSFARFEDLVEEIALMRADIAKHEGVVIAERTDDILHARQQGRLAFLPTVEHLAIGGELHRVDVLYGLGVRLAGLTYARRSYIGDGQDERVPGGVSGFGVRVIRRMNELGMVIDLSHAADRTAIEAIELSQVPCVFSHNAAYALRPTARARRDAELLACARRGGIVGVTAIPNALSDDPNQDIACVLDHYDYLVRMLGVDHVAIGTDTIVGDAVAFQRALMEGGKARPLPAPYLDGLESPADGENIVRGLIARGYDDEAIRKIAGENALRVLRAVIG